MRKSAHVRRSPEEIQLSKPQPCDGKMCVDNLLWKVAYGKELRVEEKVHPAALAMDAQSDQVD